MNVNPGGKQPKMHSTIFNGQIQHMVFPDDYLDSNLQGKPKGMRIVLQERGLWNENLIRFCKNETLKENCCMRHILEQQEDFCN